MTVRRSWLAAALLLVLALAATPACTSGGNAVGAQPWKAASATSAPTGMPPDTDRRNVYAAAGANMFSDVVRTAKPLVYVPHTESGDLWEIDPATYSVVAKYPLGGGELQHVVPSWDLRTLYVSDDTQNRLIPVNPATGSPGTPIPVTDPYNLCFTPRRTLHHLRGREAQGARLLRPDDLAGAGHAANP